MVNRKNNLSFINKALGLLLALFFLVFSSGLAVNIHYCSGKVSSIKLVTPSDKCGCAKAKDSCCKNQVKVFKIDNSYTKSSVKTLNYSFKLIAVTQDSFYRRESGQNSEAFLFDKYLPPGPAGLPIYLRINRLII